MKLYTIYFTIDTYYLSIYLLNVQSVFNLHVETNLLGTLEYNYLKLMNYFKWKICLSVFNGSSFELFWLI